MSGTLVQAQHHQPALVCEQSVPFGARGIEVIVLPRPAAVRQGHPSRVELIRNYLLLRRMRDHHLPPEIFADPGWDILLDLYVSQLQNKTVSISSACIAAGVPATTALRWINRLSTLGLVDRKNDPVDGRRSFLELTASAFQSVDAWVERAMLTILTD